MSMHEEDVGGTFLDDGVELSLELMDFVYATQYFDYRKTGQRIGQAWYNALLPQYAPWLVGTIYDPFYVSNDDAPDKLIEAAVFLLTKVS